MFSTTCSGRLAPVITVLMCGFFRHQANPNCAILQPRSFAIGPSWLTFAIFSGVIRFSRNHPYPSSVAREPGGTPFLYLPVRSPEANGLQIVFQVQSLDTAVDTRPRLVLGEACCTVAVPSLEGSYQVLGL